MLNFLASSFATCSKASFTLAEAHSETFNSFLTVLLYSSHCPLQGEKALLHHSMRAVSVIAACNLLQVLSEWRCQLPLTLYSCPALGTSLLSLFLGKSIPTFLARICLFSLFPVPSKVRLLSRELSPLPICQWFVPFCLQRIVVTFLA